jgi:N-acyl-D-aspartate/D-glutamate deacylase
MTRYWIAIATLCVAKWMEPMVPQFKTRGRIQERMTADIAIFDPESVTDNASCEDGSVSPPG